jgi:hypothetical protein
MELQVYIRLKKRSWLRRVFHLSGDIEGVLEYNAFKAGWGYSDVGPDPEVPEVPTENHAVLLNYVKVAGAARSGHLPSFKIGTPEGEVVGIVQAELVDRLVVQLQSLKLAIAGRTLYEEREGRIIHIEHPPDLPLPAEAGAPPRRDLPLPAAEPTGPPDPRTQTLNPQTPDPNPQTLPCDISSTCE